MDSQGPRGRPVEGAPLALGPPAVALPVVIGTAEGRRGGRGGGRSLVGWDRVPEGGWEPVGAEGPGENNRSDSGLLVVVGHQRPWGWRSPGWGDGLDREANRLMPKCRCKQLMEKRSNV